MVLTPAKVGRPVEALKVHTCSLCLQISTSTCRACSQRLPPRTRSATGQLLRSFHRFPHLPQPLSRLSVWPLPWPQWLPRKGQSPRHPTDQPPPRSVGAPRRRPPQQRRWLGGVSWPWEEKGQRVGRERDQQSHTAPCFQTVRGGMESRGLRAWVCCLTLWDQIPAL